MNKWEANFNRLIGFCLKIKVNINLCSVQIVSQRVVRPLLGVECAPLSDPGLTEVNCVDFLSGGL